MISMYVCGMYVCDYVNYVIETKINKTDTSERILKKKKKSTKLGTYFADASMCRCAKVNSAKKKKKKKKKNDFR